MKTKKGNSQKETTASDSPIANDVAVGKVHKTDNSGNTAPAQRFRLIHALLKRGHIDTIEARRELDILSPASRIMELRKRDFKIDTVWIDRETDAGKRHRVGRLDCLLQRER